MISSHVVNKTRWFDLLSSVWVLGIELPNGAYMLYQFVAMSYQSQSANRSAALSRKCHKSSLNRRLQSTFSNFSPWSHVCLNFARTLGRMSTRWYLVSVFVIYNMFAINGKKQ